MLMDITETHDLVCIARLVAGGVREHGERLHGDARDDELVLLGDLLLRHHRRGGVLRRRSHDLVVQRERHVRLDAGATLSSRSNSA